MVLLRVVLGIVLLFLGRQLFWLFVAAIGFLVGLNLAPQVFTDPPGWLLLLAGLAAGILGALLAVLVQRFAVAIAGFLAGGYLLVNLLDAFQLELGQIPEWIPFIIGGLAGGFLMAVLFDWALILLSALVGSSLIVQGLQMAQPFADLLSPTAAAVLFFVLFFIGLAVQGGLMVRDRREAVVVEERVREVEVEE